MTTLTFPKVKISDHCEITSSKRIFADEYISSGVPFYRGKEISEKQKSSDAVSDLIYISRNKFEEIKQKYGVPQKGDLLLTSVGTIGNPYLVKANEEFYFKDGNITWFRNFKNINSQWLYYWFLSSEGKAELNKCTIGSSQKAYTINLLLGLQLELPDMRTQEQVVSVISVHDDLIENNKRRIKLLEEMVQFLYTEWFVKFNFPGHEKVKMVESGAEYGIIPEGWRIETFGGLFDVKYGKNLPTVNISKTGKYKVYGAGGIIGFYDLKNVDLKTTLITCRGNGSGTVWRTLGEGFVTNNSFTVTGKEKKLNFEFIYNCLKNCNISASISGSAQPQITIESINFVKFILPTEDLLELFSRKTKSLYELSDDLRQKNQILSNVRDLLISQLVTGKKKLN